jgi:hypothetical protein
MRLRARSPLPHLLAVLLLGLCLSSRAEAQFYTYRSNWDITAAGAPVPARPYLVLNPPTWGGFAPRLSVGVVDDGGFPWTSMTLTQVAGPPGGVQLLFGDVTVNNGGIDCTNFVDSACQGIVNPPRAGIYTLRATVNPGLQVANLVVVVGGGSGVPVPGPNAFVINGTSTGQDYSYALSLGNANPVMVDRPAQPGGAPGAAFAADFVNSINTVYDAANPQGEFTAVLVAPGGAGFVIDTVPPGLPFRFWVGDAGAPGIPVCQVTGGACEFNPQIIDVTAAAAMPAMPAGAVVALSLLAVGAAWVLLSRRARADTGPLEG